MISPLDPTIATDDRHRLSLTVRESYMERRPLTADEALMLSYYLDSDANRISVESECERTRFAA